jgi:hypothetical protein
LRHPHEPMADALAIRTKKERALEDRRNKYALGAPRYEKLHIDLAIRTLRRLGNFLARIEQHGANFAPHPAVFYQDLRSWRLNLQLNYPTFETIAPVHMAATFPTAHNLPSLCTPPVVAPPPRPRRDRGSSIFLHEPVALALGTHRMTHCPEKPWPAASYLGVRVYWAPHSNRNRSLSARKGDAQIWGKGSSYLEFAYRF